MQDLNCSTSDSICSQEKSNPVKAMEKQLAIFERLFVAGALVHTHEIREFAGEWLSTCKSEHYSAEAFAISVKLLCLSALVVLNQLRSSALPWNRYSSESIEDKLRRTMIQRFVSQAREDAQAALELARSLNDNSLIIECLLLRSQVEHSSFHGSEDGYQFYLEACKLAVARGSITENTVEHFRLVLDTLRYPFEIPGNGPWRVLVHSYNSVAALDKCTDSGQVNIPAMLSLKSWCEELDLYETGLGGFEDDVL